MPPPEDRSREERRATARKHIDGSIFTKVRIYLVVFLIVLVMAVVEAAQGSTLTWLLLAGGLVIGAGLGIVAARMQRFEWLGFEQRVVAKFDLVGVVVLVLYVVFAVNRSHIVEVWVPIEHAPAVSLGLLAGVMFGQVLGIQHGLLTLRRRLLAQSARV